RGSGPPAFLRGGRRGRGTWRPGCFSHSWCSHRPPRWRSRPSPATMKPWKERATSGRTTAYRARRTSTCTTGSTLGS
ncbi:unnamed protein product, partial [Ectocarpus sp. 12 AP-2014]